MQPTKFNHSPGSRPFRRGKPGFKSGGFRGGHSAGHGGFRGRGGHGPSRKSRFADKQFSDISKFVNKATITEQAEVFTPAHNFADFQIADKLKANIAAKGYKLPSPIQDKAIPHVLHGADVVGIANTGTGKTAAFLIPLIDKVLRDPKQQILIMVPTRELATQIREELTGFTRNMGIWSVVCVGGASIIPQIKQLRYKNNFVIGTPGRLKDLIEQKHIRLGEFQTVVLDEADRMLDMGFINDVKWMMSLMPQQRHTLFFSATTTPEINGLIHQFLKNPIMISVKTRDTSKSIDQDVVRIGRNDDKLLKLAELLRSDGFSKVLVFGKTKHGVEKLAQKLTTMGLAAESIHGNKNFNHRQRSLGAFKDNKVKILVATDVAARGLDIADVSHVINFDLPATYEDYIHRIGRTGRGGKKGIALTFIEDRTKA
ncbi:MAG TPA: DEAD/DEAH box helicase [Candidatus Paceibacterota bacterium]